MKTKFLFLFSIIVLLSSCGQKNKDSDVQRTTDESMFYSGIYSFKGIVTPDEKLVSFKEVKYFADEFNRLLGKAPYSQKRYYLVVNKETNEFVRDYITNIFVSYRWIHVQCYSLPNKRTMLILYQPKMDKEWVENNRVQQKLIENAYKVDAIMGDGVINRDGIITEN